MDEFYIKYQLGTKLGSSYYKIIPALVEEHVGGAGHSPLWRSARHIGVVEIVPTAKNASPIQSMYQEISKLRVVN